MAETYRWEKDISGDYLVKLPKHREALFQRLDNFPLLTISSTAGRRFEYSLSLSSRGKYEEEGSVKRVPEETVPLILDADKSGVDSKDVGSLTTILREFERKYYD